MLPILKKLTPRANPALQHTFNPIFVSGAQYRSTSQNYSNIEAMNAWLASKIPYFSFK
jgi:hypothetical protein